MVFIVNNDILNSALAEKNDKTSSVVSTAFSKAVCFERRLFVESLRRLFVFLLAFVIPSSKLSVLFMSKDKEIKRE